MNLQRRFLPSVAALRALEALDRLGSVTAVAEEMSLTQSAVSRQLQSLEAQLGVCLLVREKRRITLTPAARGYVTDIRAALGQIAKAAVKLQIAPIGGSLTLAILPTFGMRWLVPRLADFARLHPEITINLSTQIKQFNFASQGFDAALHFGDGDWPGTDRLLLRTETVVPVCSAALRARLRIQTPADIAGLPLLHIESRPTAWQQWFAAQGVDVADLPGTLYDQFSTITQAALHGLGLALLPDFLVEQDLAAGRLVSVWSGPSVSLGSYYLVWPRNRRDDEALRLFREWLATQAENEDALPR